MSAMMQPTIRLEEQLKGEVIRSGDPNYDEARALYNAMIHKRPGVIARCVDRDDVVAALSFARRERLQVAVRGGGHNGAGFGSCDGGVVLDLSRMQGVSVDPRTRTVRVAPGCLQRDVDRATHAYGLAVPAGIVGSTGIAGLTLGGGHGYLSRQFGLTIDNLLECEIVLADGGIAIASSARNPDLFWALRGGGGNFGVVTSFLFRAHPVSTVYAGPIFWALEDAETIMKWYRSALPELPRNLCTFFGLKRMPPAAPFPAELHGRQVCALISCWNGDEREGVAQLDRVRSALPPALLDGMTGMPFPMAQGMFDGLLPKGLHWYWKGDYVDELSDAAVEIHLEHGSKLPEGPSLMHLYPIDGAVHDVASDATAWSARDARWSMVIAGIDADPNKAAESARWAKQYWAALNPLNRKGAYVNFMMDEGASRVRAAYGGNYPRLAAIKAKYDPDNIFHINQNIEPAPARGD